MIKRGDKIFIETPYGLIPRTVTRCHRKFKRRVAYLDRLVIDPKTCSMDGMPHDMYRQDQVGDSAIYGGTSADVSYIEFDGKAWHFEFIWRHNLGRLKVLIYDPE